MYLYPGGAAVVVSVVVTPLDSPVSASTAQTRNEYWVKPRSPTIVLGLEADVVVVPALHVAGAVAPVWYAILNEAVEPPPLVQLNVTAASTSAVPESPDGFGGGAPPTDQAVVCSVVVEPDMTPGPKVVQELSSLEPCT